MHVCQVFSTGFEASRKAVIIASNRAVDDLTSAMSDLVSWVVTETLAMSASTFAILCLRSAFSCTKAATAAVFVLLADEDAASFGGTTVGIAAVDSR